MYSFEVADAQINQRVDHFLVQHLDMSRSHIQKLITEGKVTVNAKVTKSNHKLTRNDIITVTVEEAVPNEVLAEDIPLDIVYEDQDLIVINKRRGMVVHPAAGHYSGTLVNALLNHCSDLSGINGTVRPGIVHRLDKDTSGIMVVAKTERAHLSLAQQIKDKEAVRKYIAIVHGNIAEEKGIINAPIGRHQGDRKKMAVVFTNSKEATTYFDVIERFVNFTVVECRLKTGRTHQIRVHMAHIGYPVVGDPKYGPAKCPFSIQGQALHSKELSFLHPVSGERMYFMVPLPEDMEKIIIQLRKNVRK